MSTQIRAIQVGWDITVLKADCDALRLTANAGAICVLPAPDNHVTLSTLERSMFERWCAVLDKAGRPYRSAKPAGH